MIRTPEHQAIINRAKALGSAGACPTCGERHSRRLTCSEVVALTDGVSVGNPEGSYLPRWPEPSRPFVTDDRPSEWDLR